MTQPQSEMAELNREWLSARVVFVAGFVIAIAFAVFWSMTNRAQLKAVANSQAVAVSDAGVPATSNEGMVACRAAVVAAENFGVLPNTLKFAGGPTKTDTVGRYTCLADDNAGTRYSVTFDLVCRQINNERCVSIYQATKPDGTVLYQRQGNGVAESTEAPASDTPAPDRSTEAAPATPEDGYSGDAAPSSDDSAPQQP